jgi:thymidylate synthase (FAD)
LGRQVEGAVSTSSAAFLPGLYFTGRSDMAVKLISITPDAEKLVLYIARVSSDQTRTDPGLIKFLIRNNHWSPFMHAFATCEFDTSRHIAHQMIRHWTLACLESGDIPGVQEFSQRYSSVTHTIKYQPRMKGASNRQSSLDTAPDFIRYAFEEAQKRVEETCFDEYHAMLELGVAPESARFLLPESVATRLYLSGSIRTWIHYLRERCSESTQLEHRELALRARGFLMAELPVISEALGWA